MDKTVPVRMPYVVAAFALLSVVVSAFSSASFAAASGSTANSCQTVFRDSSPDSVPAYARSEAYRLSLANRARRVLQDTFELKTIEISEFHENVQRRNLVTTSAVQDIMDRSQDVARYHMTVEALPPQILRETLEAMEDPKVSPVRLRSILKRDPYFVWLAGKGNSLEFPIRNKHPKEKLGQDAFVQANPIELYFKYRHAGLSNELAFIQIQANLDTTLLPETQASAEHLLFLTETIRVLEGEILPILSYRARIAGLDDPWMMMTSLPDGRKNLRAMFDQHIRIFGKMFSRESYERVVSLHMAKSPVFSVIETYEKGLSERRSSDDLVRELEKDLIKLRRSLKLSAKFPLAKIYPSVRFILDHLGVREFVDVEQNYVLPQVKEYFVKDVPEASYEMFLIRNFSMPTVVANADVLELYRLVEFASAADSDGAMTSYLNKRAAAAMNKYRF